jgi:hypothetical protein
MRVCPLHVPSTPPFSLVSTKQSNRHRRLPQPCPDISILPTEIPRRRIVAHGKVRANPAAGILKRAALHRRAANLLGIAPHDLRKVAPLVEVAHVGVVLAVEAFVGGGFVIVHAVGDHGGDFGAGGAGADVLAVAGGVEGFVGLTVGETRGRELVIWGFFLVRG